MVLDLPAPLGPEEAERLAASYVEVDAADRLHGLAGLRAERLAQADGPDHRLGAAVVTVTDPERGRRQSASG